MAREAHSRLARSAQMILPHWLVRLLWALPASALQGFCECVQAPGFQEQVVDLLALVLASMAGPEAHPSVAAAGDPARAQVRAAACSMRVLPDRGRGQERPVCGACRALCAIL